MSNGYDANGWEREPFGAEGNVRNPEFEFDGPAKWQKPARSARCDGCRGTGYRTDPALGVHGSDLHPCSSCAGVGVVA